MLISKPNQISIAVILLYYRITVIGQRYYRLDNVKVRYRKFECRKDVYFEIQP